MFYGKSPDEQQNIILKTDDTFVLPKGAEWFRLATPSNVEILVNDQMIDTLAQDLPTSYRIKSSPQ